MRGVILPGQARGEIEEFDRPEPGACQVLVETKASGLCGSDLRAVYHGHRGSDPNERYHNVIAGHEPAGRIEAVGPGVEGFGPGDRIVYLGEGGPVTFEPSPLLLHTQLTLHGSWTCGIHEMGQLPEHLARRGLHPAATVTHAFSLSETKRATRPSTPAGRARS